MLPCETERPRSSPSHRPNQTCRFEKFTSRCVYSRRRDSQSFLIAFPTVVTCWRDDEQRVIGAARWFTSPQMSWLAAVVLAHRGRRSHTPSPSLDRTPTLCRSRDGWAATKTSGEPVRKRLIGEILTLCIQCLNSDKQLTPAATEL